MKISPCLQLGSINIILALTACSTPPDLGQSAAAGRPVSVDVVVHADGSLHASRVYIEESDEDSGVDCEDGLTAEGQECDGGPAANQDGEENEGEEPDGEVDCIDGLTVDGVECDGGPAANQDDGEQVDADGDGDVDEEDSKYDAGNARSFVQDVPTLLPESGLYQLLGITVNSGANLVGTGAVRFTGKYNGADHFSASTAQAGRTGRSIGGVSEGIVEHDDGSWTLTLMGRPVDIANSAKVVETDDALEPEEEGDDGQECEQDGEHEGENEGC